MRGLYSGRLTIGMVVAPHQWPGLDLTVVSDVVTYFPILLVWNTSWVCLPPPLDWTRFLSCWVWLPLVDRSCALYSV